VAKILIACEYSGVVREAFTKLGWHTVVSCDLLPTEIPGDHYQGDVLEILNQGWDLMIGHPPCTYLCNSGVRWLHTEPGRWEKMKDAALFFKTLLESNIPRICIENPIQHKYPKEIIGKDYTQIIQPWMFGHGETKATCLWLKGLERLEPTNIVEGREQRIHLLPPSKDRWKLRSKTFQGIADAMAAQWGKELK
jgi:hypothetical protein